MNGSNFHSMLLLNELWIWMNVESCVESFFPILYLSISSNFEFKKFVKNFGKMALSDRNNLQIWNGPVKSVDFSRTKKIKLVNIFLKTSANFYVYFEAYSMILIYGKSNKTFWMNWVIKFFRKKKLFFFFWLIVISVWPHICE